MRYYVGKQTIIETAYGLEGVYMADLVFESDSLKECVEYVKKELDGKNILNPYIDDLKIAQEYVCYTINDEEGFHTNLMYYTEVE